MSLVIRLAEPPVIVASELTLMGVRSSGSALFRVNDEWAFVEAEASTYLQKTHFYRTSQGRDFDAAAEEALHHSAGSIYCFSQFWIVHSAC
jgi:hypothetical protein